VKEYVLAANAVLRYFGASAGRGTNKVRALFEQAERGQAGLSMSGVNLGKVFFVLFKHPRRSPPNFTIPLGHPKLPNFPWSPIPPDEGSIFVPLLTRGRLQCLCRLVGRDAQSTKIRSSPQLK
jgi:hypothetical protein